MRYLKFAVVKETVHKVIVKRLYFAPLKHFVILAHAFSIDVEVERWLQNPFRVTLDNIFDELLTRSETENDHVFVESTYPEVFARLLFYG